jgi:condensin complex subunit 3
MGLFCDFYRLGQEEGRSIALQIIFDLIFLFGLEYFESKDEDEEAGKKSEEKEGGLNIMRVITTTLYDPVERIQIISSEGFAKLFLHRVINDKQVLEGLFHLYLHPATLASSPIKQCLSYFFQAYAFISPESQLSIGSLVGKILGSWIRISRQSSQSLVSLNSVANQLLYLVDRANLIQSAPRSSLEAYNEMIAQIAVDLSWVILNDPLDESSKILSSIICKLPLKSLSSPEAPPLLKQLLFLQTQIMKYITDKITINTLKRFTANLLQLDTQEEPLDFEIINEMRAQMLKILPPGIKLNTAANSTNPVNKKTKVVTNENISGNIMDDISDLLEDE